MKTKEISDREIEEARQVLNNHLVNPLTREGAIECGVWCIASQGTPWETASRLIYNLRGMSRPGDSRARFKYATLGTLRDLEKVNLAAHNAGWRFAYNRRFDEFIRYFGNMTSNWWENVRDDDSELRTKHVADVKWLSNKTYSFWHICLGGKNLIALDVYVMRGLKELGVELDEGFVNSVRRNSVHEQMVRRTPCKREYLRIENEARQVFSEDDRFVDGGNVDMALADTVLWWRGASRGQYGQGSLFGSGGISYDIPYAHIEN